MTTDASTGGYQPPGEEPTLGSLSTDYDKTGTGATEQWADGPRGDTTTGSAKDEAGKVGQTAKDAGGQVASTAADQAKNVAGETKNQARNLLNETQSQVNEQAGTQKDKAAGGLRGLSDELRSLADGTGYGQSGMATDFSRQASDKMKDLADWLEARDPGQLLDEVRDIARRKPGTFLLGAAVAGVLAGRLTRGVVDAKRDESDDSTPRMATEPTPSAWSDPQGGYATTPASDDVLVVDEVVVETDPFGARPQQTSMGGDRL